jgi:peptidoglycan/xylan/chitin deacetylase (PgdA/CDA1 family)
MGQPLTIIMYHYVRDLERSRYTDIKGLTLHDFRSQIEYVRERYNVISGEHLIAAVTEDVGLPPRAALLTFDDGYLDHFTNVFPILDGADLPGCFFPPARCVLDREVLDVNKIHYVLASASDVGEVENQVFQLMEKWGRALDLHSRDEYCALMEDDHRFDKSQVVLVKRLLQRELPRSLRGRILDHLFDTYVDVTEEVLAEELYMSLDQVQCLRRHGMYVGSHGNHHDWMNCLDPVEQKTSVNRSLEFLDTVGTQLDQWIMCYPYGAHDTSLRSCLRERGCVAGLATGGETANLGQNDPLALPRLDTNDIPLSAAESA